MPLCHLLTNINLGKLMNFLSFDAQKPCRFFFLITAIMFRSSQGLLKTYWLYTLNKLLIFLRQFLHLHNGYTNNDYIGTL